MTVRERGKPAHILIAIGTAVSVLMCALGLWWQSRIAPGLDDSDPDAYLGEGVLLFSAPALVLSLIAILAGSLPVRGSKNASRLAGVWSLMLTGVLMVGLSVWFAAVPEGLTRLFKSLP